jgi:MFS family permease
MVRPAILRHRPLAGANLAIIANAGGFTGMTFMATLYMQQVLGFGALEAGLAFLPLALMATAGGLAAPRLIDRAGPRRTATISLAVTAAAFLFLARVPADDGYLPVVLPGFVVAGFSFATAFVPLTSQGMTRLREGEKGLASGLFQTSTHLGGALILATAAAARTEAARAAGEAGATALTSGFAVAFVLAAGILALGGAERLQGAAGPGREQGLRHSRHRGRRLGQLLGQAAEERVEIGLAAGLPIVDEVAQAGDPGDDQLPARLLARGRDGGARHVAGGAQLAQRGVEARWVDPWQGA